MVGGRLGRPERVGGLPPGVNRVAGGTAAAAPHRPPRRPRVPPRRVRGPQSERETARVCAVEGDAPRAHGTRIT